jgi:hypothetical protein
MRKISRYTIFLVLFGLLLLTVWYSGFKYRFVQTNTQINQEVILEQVKNVFQLGTVEGYFSDIYSYKEYYGFDISPFQKKALIRIKAKVLAGFDMDNINIEIDGLTKTVEISNIPFATILSIDHNLDYYDITEGTFNSFTTADYNKMNSQAKNFIENTAKNSNLLLKAQKQLEQNLYLLKTILNSNGWKLKTKFKSINRLK